VSPFLPHFSLDHLPGVGVRANAYKNQGENVKAIEDLTRALQVQYPTPSDPQRAAFHFNRADAYFKEERFFEAMNDFTNVLQLQPRHEQALAMRAASQVGREKYVEAIADANSSLLVDPTCSLALRWRGQAHFESRMFPEALSDMDAAVAILEQVRGRNESVWGETCYARGVLRNALGDEEGSKADFRLAGRIRYDLFEKDAMVRDARLETEAEKESSRTEDYEIAVCSERIRELSPGFELSYMKRGSLYLKKGEYPKALADFAKQYDSVELGPSALSLSGDAFLQQRMYTQAGAIYGQALGRNPTEIGALTGMGIVQLYNTEFDAAMDTADKVLSIQYSNAKGHGIKGSVLFHTGDSHAAMAEFDTAIGLDSGDAWCSYMRRRVNFSLGKYGPAFDDYHNAIEADKSYDGATANEVLLELEGVTEEELAATMEAGVEGMGETQSSLGATNFNPAGSPMTPLAERERY
jgi:tetratricopeptide (TPR) repeat protein